MIEPAMYLAIVFLLASLLGVILGGQAWLASRQNDYEQARELVQQAIAQQTTALDLNPRNPDYQNRLAQHKQFFDDLKSRTARVEAAAK